MAIGAALLMGAFKRPRLYCLKASYILKSNPIMGVNPHRSSWNDFFLLPGAGMTEFRDIFHSSKHVVVITGGGISVESGIPTFLGAGGIWRNRQVQELASRETFRRNPSMVWEFYHYQRELMKDKEPNPGTIVEIETEILIKKQNIALILDGNNVDFLNKRVSKTHMVALKESLARLKGELCHSVK
ncbi:unnamed protein product, partial [Meganyctiphanes norvegica]